MFSNLERIAILVFLIIAGISLNAVPVLGDDNCGDGDHHKPSISIQDQNDNSHVGDSITVNGCGFSNTTQVTLTYDNAALTTSPGTITTDSSGSFTATFSVPSSTAGSHTIKANDPSNNADTQITIASQIILSPSTGHTGSTVTVTGSGFASSSAVTLTYDSTALATSPGTI
ncbi:MAG: hypothetical protein KGI27_15535, partial [Thaumarchaeota archaeon]|nr:hypothetical protein [Nitrososphaerota archaeon]